MQDWSQCIDQVQVTHVAAIGQGDEYRWCRALRPSPTVHVVHFVTLPLPTINMQPFIHLSFCLLCFLINCNSKAVNPSISLRRLHSAGFAGEVGNGGHQQGTKGHQDLSCCRRHRKSEDGDTVNTWTTVNLNASSSFECQTRFNDTVYFLLHLVSPACCYRSTAKHCWLWCKHQACFFYHSLHPSWWSPPGTNGSHSDTPTVHHCPPEKYSSYLT